MDRPLAPFAINAAKEYWWAEEIESGTICLVEYWRPYDPSREARVLMFGDEDAFAARFYKLIERVDIPNALKDRFDAQRP
jgi:hypothetical protein